MMGGNVLGRKKLRPDDAETLPRAPADTGPHPTHFRRLPQHEGMPVEPHLPRWHELSSSSSYFSFFLSFRKLLAANRFLHVDVSLLLRISLFFYCRFFTRERAVALHFLYDYSFIISFQQLEFSPAYSHSAVLRKWTMDYVQQFRTYSVSFVAAYFLLVSYSSYLHWWNNHIRDFRSSSPH